MGPARRPAVRVRRAARSGQPRPEWSTRPDGGRGSRPWRPAPERRADGRDLIGSLDGARTIAIAVHGEQHLGVDLAEAIDHAAHAELGRARGPDGARLAVASSATSASGVRQVAGRGRPGRRPAVQAGAGARHLVAQLGHGQGLPLARLRARDHHDVEGLRWRSRRACSAQFRLAPGNQRAPGMRSSPSGPPPTWTNARQGGPRPIAEGAKVVRRPAPELVVGAEPHPALPIQPVQVVAHARRRTDVGWGRPQDRRVGHGPIMPRAAILPGPMPATRVVSVRAAVLGLAVAAAAGWLPATALGTSAIPADQTGRLLDGNPITAIVGDIDGDGVRELIRLGPRDDDPVHLAVEVLEEGPDGEVVSAGSAPLATDGQRHRAAVRPAGRMRTACCRRGSTSRRGWSPGTKAAASTCWQWRSARCATRAPAA